MKDYKELFLEVILIESNDVITKSVYDPEGILKGDPDEIWDWEDLKA